MATATACTAVLGFLVIGLGLGVSRQRGLTKTASGYKDDPTDPLYKWIRAHGNTVEYAPMLAVMMLALGNRVPSSWIEWTMILATLARISTAIGIIAWPTMAKPNPMRMFGAIGTYLAGFGLAGALLFG